MTTLYVNPEAYTTIQAANSVAKSGDTILIAPGIYRERVVPPSSNIQYRAADPSNPPIIRGSVPWRPTEKVGTLWRGTLDPALFTDNSQVDGPNPFAVPFCVTPFGLNGRPESAEKMTPTPDPSIQFTLGQVWINNTEVLQVGNRASMIPNTWYYDLSDALLYVYVSDDDLENLEITNQRRLFAPHIRGLKNICIDGLVFERCGNQYPNQFWLYPANQQAGAVGTRCGKYWTIRNCTIRHATGIGIDWGNEGKIDQDIEYGKNGPASGSYGHSIMNCVISHNGAAGTAAYMAKNVVFSENVVTQNNLYKFYGKRRWESAGLKIHCPTGYVIQNNMITENYCHGVWCDQGGGIGCKIASNRISANVGAGINFEIGVGMSCVVEQNRFEQNDVGICLVTSGGTEIRNNVFASSNSAHIQTVLFSRPNDKWDSMNVCITKNQFESDVSTCMILTPNDPAIPASRIVKDNVFNGDGMKFSLVSGKVTTTYSLDKWLEYWC